MGFWTRLLATPETIDIEELRADVGGLRTDVLNLRKANNELQRQLDAVDGLAGAMAQVLAGKQLVSREELQNLIERQVTRLESS